MKLKSLLLAGTVALSLQSNAQGWVEDSVEMGANFSNDIFYSLKNSTVKTEDASNWHLAFQMTQFGEPSFNATIRANHIKGKVEVYSLHLDSTSFATLSATDTIGKTLPTMQLVNIDTSWGTGAFLQNRGSNIFDFGWGFYQGPPTHSVKGDSIYLVKVNNVAYKLWVKEYISIGTSLIGYTFRIANLDGTNDNTVNILRNPDYTNRLFAYYNITTNTVTDREPARTTWDILFTQYPKYLIFGPSGLQSYTGVLTNEGVKVTEVIGDPDTIAAGSYTNYITNMSGKINEIGDDWKTFDMSSFTYQIDTMKSWIIKSSNTQEYYQLKFTRFDGGSGGATGKSVFAKRFLAVTSVKELVSNISAYGIYPNPANNNVNIMIDAKEKANNAQVIIRDMTGKIVYNSAVYVNGGLNAYSINTSSFAPGTYIVTLTNGAWKTAEKIVVQH